jgi:hypothetical protein
MFFCCFRNLLISLICIINCYAYTTTSSYSDDIHNSSIQVSNINMLIQYVGKGSISEVLPLYADSVSYTFSNGSSFNGNKYEWISFLQKWRSSKDTLIPNICSMIVSKDSVSEFIEVQHSWISSSQGKHDSIIRTSVFRFNDNKIQRVSQFDRPFFSSYEQLHCSKPIIYADRHVDETIHNIITQLLICENTASWTKNKNLFNENSLSVYHSNNNMNTGNTKTVLEALDISSKSFSSINSLSSNYYTYSINNSTYISLYGSRSTIDVSMKMQKTLFHRIIALDSNNSIVYILAKAQKDK